MKKIALLISDNLLPDAVNARVDIFELIEQMGKLVPAFAEAGMELQQIRWREIADRADEFDAILPLMVWDYFEGNEDAFLSAIAKAEQSTPVFNGFDVLKWNADKAYLDDLENRGAPTIQTVSVDRITQSAVARAFDALETNIVVIKPRIGGGAWRQVLYKQGDPFPDADELPPEGALIQAFLPSVKERANILFSISAGVTAMPSRKPRKKAITAFNRAMAAKRRLMNRVERNVIRRARFSIRLMRYRFMRALTL